MNNINNRAFIALFAACLALACNVRAEQGGAGHYAPGSYTDFTTMPPAQPGWYVANYFLDYQNATFGGSRGLPRNGLIAVGLTANSQAESPMVVYAYPFDLCGGALSTAVYPSYQWLKVQAQASLTLDGMVATAAREDSASGFGDMQWTPIQAAWTNGNFTYGGMFNIWSPTGNYQQGRLASIGLGYWTLEPMLAMSWFSQKLGTEFTIFPAVDFNSKNRTADYKSGDIFHVDATLAQHLPLAGGYMGAGASAFYLKQITGDSGSGARLGGFEAMTYGVGPTVSYFHKIRKMTLFADCSWLPQLHADNTTKGNFFWARVTLQL